MTMTTTAAPPKKDIYSPLELFDIDRLIDEDRRCGPSGRGGAICLARPARPRCLHWCENLNCRDISSARTNDGFDLSAGATRAIRNFPVLPFDISADHILALELSEQLGWNAAVGKLGSVGVNDIEQHRLLLACGFLGQRMSSTTGSSLPAKASRGQDPDFGLGGALRATRWSAILRDIQEQA